MIAIIVIISIFVLVLLILVAVLCTQPSIYAAISRQVQSYFKKKPEEKSIEEEEQQQQQQSQMSIEANNTNEVNRNNVTTPINKNNGSRIQIIYETLDSETDDCTPMPKIPIKSIASRRVSDANLSIMRSTSASMLSSRRSSLHSANETQSVLTMSCSSSTNSDSSSVGSSPSSDISSDTENDNKSRTKKIAKGESKGGSEYESDSRLSRFTNLFKTSPPVQDAQPQYNTQSSFNGNVLQANDSINFQIPKRSKKIQSNLPKNSMHRFSISVSQLNITEYNADTQNRQQNLSPFTNAVNLYDTPSNRRKSVISIYNTNQQGVIPDIETLNPESIKLKCSIFYDKISKIIKFHIISIIDLANIEKLEGQIHSNICKLKNELSSKEENSKSKVNTETLHHSKTVATPNLSSVVTETAKKCKCKGVSEVYLKVQFNTYDSKLDDSSNLMPRDRNKKRLSVAFKEKILGNKKSLLNHLSCKTKHIKVHSKVADEYDASEGTHIDQVFAYPITVVKEQSKQTNSKTKILSEENTENEEESENLNTIFLVIKVGLHNSSTKKKIGKMEILLNYFNLNMSPFNIFLQEFIPISKNGEQSDSQSQSAVSKEDSSFTKTFEKLKSNASVQLLISMLYFSQTQQIHMKLLKIKVTGDAKLKQTLTKFYFYCKVSMYVQRRRVKKKCTKFYRVDQKNIQNPNTYDDLSDSSIKVANALESDKNDSYGSWGHTINETFMFNCMSVKFDQVCFYVDLHIKQSKNHDSKHIGKISIGSINFCTNVNGFTQMENMLRNAGNEIVLWHKFI